MQITIDENYLNEICQRAARFAVREFSQQNRVDEVMTKKQLGEYFGWSPSTVNRKMKQGLPHSGGGHPRFRRSEVERWLTQNESSL